MEFLRIIFVLAPLLAPVFSVSQEVEQLLEEMSGSHLRFSASPVLNIYISLQILFSCNNKAIFFKYCNRSLSQIPSLLDVRRNRNGTFSYSGFHVEVVEFVSRVLNIR